MNPVAPFTLHMTTYSFDDTVLLVMTTVASQTEAQMLARSMVERTLAACAQISEIKSIYRWEGAVQQDGEWRVLLKTVAARYAELEAALKAAHPYELPAIVAWPASHASAEFAAWVAAEAPGEGAHGTAARSAP